ncbi:hypothetical protein HK097_003661, partial [Rhizophlyctis rosea]
MFQDKYIRALEERIDAIREVTERDRIIHERDAEILRLERDVVAPLRAENFWLRQQLTQMTNAQAHSHAAQAVQQAPHPHSHAPAPQHIPPQHQQQAAHPAVHPSAHQAVHQNAHHQPAYQPQHAAVSQQQVAQQHQNSHYPAVTQQQAALAPTYHQHSKHPAAPAPPPGAQYMMMPGRPESRQEDSRSKNKSPVEQVPPKAAPTPSPVLSQPPEIKEAPRLGRPPMHQEQQMASTPTPILAPSSELFSGPITNPIEPEEDEADDIPAPPGMIPWSHIVRKAFPGSLSQLKSAERNIISSAVRGYLEDKLGEKAAECKMPSKVNGKDVDAIPQELEQDFLKWFVSQ